MFFISPALFGLIVHDEKSAGQWARMFWIFGVGIILVSLANNTQAAALFFLLSIIGEFCLFSTRPASRLHKDGARRGEAKRAIRKRIADKSRQRRRAEYSNCQIVTSRIWIKAKSAPLFLSTKSFCFYRNPKGAEYTPSALMFATIKTVGGDNANNKNKHVRKI